MNDLIFTIHSWAIEGEDVSGHESFRQLNSSFPTTMSPPRAVISVDFEYFSHTPAYRNARGTITDTDIGLGAMDGLLDILDDADAKATFFVVSDVVERRPGLAVRRPTLATRSPRTPAATSISRRFLPKSDTWSFKARAKRSNGRQERQ